jgi:hypothetical protein
MQLNMQDDRYKETLGNVEVSVRAVPWSRPGSHAGPGADEKHQAAGQQAGKQEAGRGGWVRMALTFGASRYQQCHTTKVQTAATSHRV